jgi:PadR family transcriptional regulator, regulatory protein PadR
MHRRPPPSSNRFDKDLATGSYDLIVLDVLRDGPAYGYQIKRRIWEQSNSTLRWRDGTIYRVLHDLQRRQLVTSRLVTPTRGHERRYYRLTARGNRAWQDQRQQWRTFVAALNALLGL